MRKGCTKIIKSVISLSIVIAMMSTTCFAAWWGTPGYEWAREKRLTTLANNSGLNNSVSLTNFYSILIKYLQYKGVRTRFRIIQDVGATHNFNNALNGMLEDIDEYINKTSLTPNEYRIVATYIDHADRAVQEQATLISRDDLKDFYLYLALAKYRAATLIDEYSYKVYVLGNMGPVKYKELVTYGIMPYHAQISRKEFLILIYSLMSETIEYSEDGTPNITNEDILDRYRDAGVLIGYDDDDMLEKELTYAEMFTFMRRFEIFDFSPVEETEEGESEDDEIVEYK